MQTSSQRTYETVHFPEYLDNGQPELQIQDIRSLITNNRQEKETYTQFSEFKKSISPSPTFKLLTAEEQSRKNSWLVNNIGTHCTNITGEKLVDISFPGGVYRKSMRVHFADSSLIATTRLDPGRALLEERVLSKFQSHLSTPEIFGFTGLLLLQEDIQGQTLDHAIENADENKFYQLAEKSLISLHQIHRQAELSQLDLAVPMIGYSPDWLIKFLDRSAVIGGYLNLPAPPIRADQLFDLLVLIKPRFVKWDARPGNAILTHDNQIRWFDWEHCGARNRLDDMVWFLCDDKIPNYPEAENKLIEQHLDSFADGHRFDFAHDYLRAYGVLHMCVRLGRMLYYKGQNSWNQLDETLNRKTHGTSLKQAQRLCTRASYWSDQISALNPLTGWFLELRDRLEDL